MINDVHMESYSRISEQSLSWSGSVSIGAFSYVVQGAFVEGCDIGRFCSIATGVRVMGKNHPLDRISTSTWSYGHNIFDLMKQDFDVEVKQDRKFGGDKKTIIDHDVWIGEFATIKRGIKLGLGSIVGANSVVTKDVPPFAIVGGNPAKILKYRFNDVVIGRLIKSKWWEFNPKTLARLDMTDIYAFLDEIETQELHYDYPKYNLKEILTRIEKVNEII